jgi:TM2 domain-containing membrane protein YozV
MRQNDWYTRDEKFYERNSHQFCEYINFSIDKQIDFCYHNVPSKTGIGWYELKFVTQCLICTICLLLFIQHSLAQTDAPDLVVPQTDEPRLVSPIGAVIRSAVLPGWGQFYIRSYVRGGISVVGLGSSLAGALVAQRSFQEIYNNDYARAAIINPKSKEAVFQYNRANEKFKLRQFFLYAAAGIWAYSIIDAYVGANFYNATTKADLLIDDAKRIEKLGVQVGLTPTQFHLSVIKSF